jgi:hypothetical protein
VCGIAYQVSRHDDGKLPSSPSSSLSATHSRRAVLFGSIFGTLLGLPSVGFGICLYIRFRRRRRRIAPSQQYVANPRINNWFDEGKVITHLQPSSVHSISDLQAEMASVRAPSPRIMHPNSEGIQALQAIGSRLGTQSDAASSEHKST